MKRNEKARSIKADTARGGYQNNMIEEDQENKKRELSQIYEVMAKPNSLQFMSDASLKSNNSSCCNLSSQFMIDDMGESKKINSNSPSVNYWHVSSKEKSL